jgi:hypothetical protein
VTARASSRFSFSTRQAVMRGRARWGVLVDDPVGVAVHPPPGVHMGAASRPVVQCLRRCAVDVRSALGAAHPERDPWPFATEVRQLPRSKSELA